MSDSPVSPVSSDFGPASARRKQELSAVSADSVAAMMAEFQAAIRGLEEKLEASGMENDLLQQRLAEMVDKRSGNSPAPPLKFANNSENIKHLRVFINMKIWELCFDQSSRINVIGLERCIRK